MIQMPYFIDLPASESLSLSEELVNTFDKWTRSSFDKVII